MPNRVRVLEVRAEDSAELERRAHSDADPARVVLRARIVLLSAHGLSGRVIAERLACSEPTVVAWRRRYAAHGLAGLDDAARLGGPVWVMTPEVRAQVLADTVTPPPGDDAPWSARRLAHRLATLRGLDLSHDSIAALWRRCCLWRDPVTGFGFRTEPALDATVHDLVALFVDTSWAAVVVRQGTPPADAPPPPGPAADLLRELEAVVRVVGSASPQGPRGIEPFIAELTRAHPHGRLHLVQQAADRHLTAVLSEHARIQLHTTSTGCSWPALVDCLHTLTSRREGGESVADLVTALRTRVDDGSPPGEPFSWVRPSGGSDRTSAGEDGVPRP
jgi:transposase